MNSAYNITVVAEERIADDAFGGIVSAFTFNGRILCHNEYVTTVGGGERRKPCPKPRALKTRNRWNNWST